MLSGSKVAKKGMNDMMAALDMNYIYHRGGFQRISKFLLHYIGLFIKPE